MADKVAYKQGRKATYLGLRKHYDNALYFCTDTKELFRGDDLYTDGVRLVASAADLPDCAVAADGKLYYCQDTGNGCVLDEARTGWLTVLHGADGETIGLTTDGLLAVKKVAIGTVDGLQEQLDALTAGLQAVPITAVVGLEDRLTELVDGLGPAATATLDETQFEVTEDGVLRLKDGAAVGDESLAETLEAFEEAVTWSDM